MEQKMEDTTTERNKENVQRVAEKKISFKNKLEDRKEKAFVCYRVCFQIVNISD